MSQTSSGRSFNAAPSPTIATVAESSITSAKSEGSIHQDVLSSTVEPLQSSRIITEEASQLILANPTETPEQLNDDDIVLSVLQQRLKSHKPVKTMAENLLRQASATEAPHQTTNTEQPILSPSILQKQSSSIPRPDSQVEVAPSIPSVSAQIEASPVPSNASQNGDGEKKPMSAQDRRRAAHARRMQLAFGDAPAA
jgi:hypothetical protein